MWRSTGMTSRSLSNSEIVMLDTRTDWVLADHRMRNGMAILPGSAYAGLARHAALGTAGEDALRIENLLFLTPLMVPDDQTVGARVALRNGKFSVSTEGNGYSTNHATADVSLLPKQSRLRHNLEEIRERCQRGQQAETDASVYTRQGEYVAFGKRWNVIRGVSFGDGEALLELALPEEFQDDTLAHPLHPALLDWATSGGLPVAPGYDLDPRLHVPMSVAEITVYQRFPPRIVSHVRLSSSGSSGYDTVVFDATICDEDGWELATVQGFTLRRIEKSAEFLPAPGQTRGKLELSPLEAIANAAMLPEEGAAAFARILASPVPGRVIVSPLPLRTLLERVRPQRRELTVVAADDGQDSGDEVEQWLAETFRDLLGVPRVRPEDDFFALGGHSLIAVRLFLRIRKKYQLDLGISTLFEARPLAKLAALIRSRTGQSGDDADGKAAERWSSVVPIQPGAPQRPAIYLIHGVGGNVVGFEPLVRRLGKDYPVSAIQCVGIDGKLKPLTRVEDMAARYIEDIRAVQPRGPYHLIGYSFGGMIAYEMAQQLTAAGETVGFVGMMDTWQHAWLPWHRRRTLAARILRHGRRVLFGPDRLAYLTSHLGLLRRLTSANLDVQRGVQTSLPQDLFHIVNARAAFDYVPKPYAGQVTLFRAKERHDDDPYPYHLGWEGLAKGGLEIHEVPGSHLSMGEEPNVGTLTELLQRCLPALR
jgi:thioesterase domain-containing protein/acyl carrier protein